MAIFNKSLEDYIALGGGYFSLTPMMGDVFMDKLLPDRIEVIRGRPEITGLGITTNAAMCHRFGDVELADIMTPVTKLSISIYGTTEEEYEAITGRRTYDEMKDGINRLVRLTSLEMISFEFRLSKRRTRAELAQWLQDQILGAPDYARNCHRFKINTVLTEYANWGIYNAENTPLPGDAKWLPFTRREEQQQCIIPMLSYVVFPNGNVSFCSCDNFDDAEELRLGNIMEHSLAELCTSEKAQKLWDWATHGTPEFCKGCSFHIPMAIKERLPNILIDPHPIVGAG